MAQFSEQMRQLFVTARNTDAEVGLSLADWANQLDADNQLTPEMDAAVTDFGYLMKNVRDDLYEAMPLVANFEAQIAQLGYDITGKTAYDPANLSLDR